MERCSVCTKYHWRTYNESNLPFRHNLSFLQQVVKMHALRKGREKAPSNKYFLWMLFLMLCWKFTVQTNNFWPFIAASFWNSSSNDSFSAPSLAKLLSNSRSSVGCAKATKQSQSDFIWETRHQQEREWTVTSHNDFHFGFLSVGNSADVFSTLFACWIHFSLILCFFRMLMLPAVHRSLISL